MFLDLKHSTHETNEELQVNRLHKEVPEILIRFQHMMSQIKGGIVF